MEEHLAEEILERYLLGHLEPWRVAAVEEHILGCPPCAERAEQLDGFIRAMRKANERPPH